MGHSASASRRILWTTRWPSSALPNYGAYLPEDIASLEIAEGVCFDDLEPRYVREHIGPMVVRGIWYPFVRVGT